MLRLIESTPAIETTAPMQPAMAAHPKKTTTQPRRPHLQTWTILALISPSL
jgi:hypothetical protein